VSNLVVKGAATMSTASAPSLTSTAPVPKPSTMSPAVAVAMAGWMVTLALGLGIGLSIGKDNTAGLPSRHLTVVVRDLDTRARIDDVKVSLDPLDIEDDDTISDTTDAQGTVAFDVDPKRPYSLKVEPKRAENCLRFPSSAEDTFEFACDYKNPDVAPRTSGR
jgi:hypothetical protein